MKNLSDFSDEELFGNPEIAQKIVSMINDSKTKNIGIVCGTEILEIDQFGCEKRGRNYYDFITGKKIENISLKDYEVV
ncbi:MAG: hypothetical protein KC516_02255 [Nanoarchaeota archaeon]|nr:hypothetical protein [Nanoarchaeota archaeon]